MRPDINAIKARNEARTPGRWFWDMNRRYKSVTLKAPQDGGTLVMDFVRWGMQSAQPRFNDRGKQFGGIMRTAVEYDKDAERKNPNADFIANCSQDIPDLLNYVKELEDELYRRATIDAKIAEMTRQ